MRCPKCGFHSFDHLEQCKKCGIDLQEHKAKFGLGSVVVAAAVEAAPAAATQDVDAAEEGSVDFGFGLMDDEEESPEVPEEVTDEPLFPGGAEEAFNIETTPEEEPDLFGGEDDDFSFDASEVAASETGEDFGDDFAVDLNEEAVPEVQEAATAAPLTEEVEELDASDFADDDLDALELDDLVSFDEEEKPSKESADPFEEPESPAPQETPEQLFEAQDDSSVEEAGDLFDAELNVEPVMEVSDEEDDLFSAAPAFGVAAAAGAGSAALDQDFVMGEDSDDEAFEPATDIPRSDEITDGFVVELPDEATGQAGVAPRLMASVIDLVLLVITGAVFVSAAEVAMGAQGIMPSLEVLYDMAIPYFLVLFGLFFGYFTLLHFLSGQTIGKMLCKIRVEGLTGGGVSLSQAFLRSVGGLLSALVLGVGYVLVLFDKRQRGWNDRLAGTRVVPSRQPAG